MAHNNYKYHVLTSGCPTSLLVSNGYPENPRQSLDGSQIMFDGKKTSDLESAFDAYVVSANMSFSEVKSYLVTNSADWTEE